MGFTGSLNALGEEAHGRGGQGSFVMLLCLVAARRPQDLCCHFWRR